MPLQEQGTDRALLSSATEMKCIHRTCTAPKTLMHVAVCHVRSPQISKSVPTIGVGWVAYEKLHHWACISVSGLVCWAKDESKAAPVAVTPGAALEAGAATEPKEALSTAEASGATLSSAGVL